MIFPTALTLLLALAPATLFAAPSRTIESRQDSSSDALEALRKSNGLCDLSQVVLPIAPTPLPQPAAGHQLRHIAIGRGTQNYTCASSSSTSTPVAVGATASLFNVTCDSTRLGLAVLVDVSRIALNYPIPTGAEAQKRLSGHHEFTSQGAPFFKLQTGAVNYGFVQGKVDSKSSAPKNASTGPNGLGSVPWLKLSGVTGDFKEVYRVNTAGGVAPQDCQNMPASFEVEYSAEYWFYA